MTDHQKLYELTILAAVTLLCAAFIFLPSREYQAISGIVPIEQAQWQSVVGSLSGEAVLPDDWVTGESSVKARRYLLRFAMPEPADERMALYIPKISQHAVYFLNGEWLGQSGELEPIMERHHNVPQWQEFSSARLQSQNELVIEVRANTVLQGMLSPVYVGPAHLLVDSWRLKTLLRVDWVQWVSLTMYLVSLILFLFWLNRRKDVIYAFFSFALFIWATHNLNLFVHRIPVSHRLWEAMTMATLGWTVVAILFFDFRFLNRPSPKIEKFMLGFSASGLLFFFLPETEQILWWGYKVWDGVLIFLGNYSMVYLIRAYRETHSRDAWLLMLVGVPILLAGLHDILLVNGFWPRTDGLFIQYSVVPTGLLFSWFLFRRFVQSLNAAEQHAQTLAIKLAENERQLRKQFEHIKSMELQGMLSEERERIMRDMHDGIGGQLLTLQSTLNQHEEPWVSSLQSQLTSTMADFRLVINSLDPVSHELPILLGQMRAQLQTLVAAGGMNLHWDVSEAGSDQPYSPAKVLHIMRIVQEAVTNAVRHSRGQNLHVRSYERSGSVIVEIADDGCGYTASSQGRGIENMQRRAETIDADIRIESTGDGMRVLLTLPI